MNIFEGKTHSQILESKIQKYIESISEVSTLAIIAFGHNESSDKYILLKERFCIKMHIPVEVHRFDTQSLNSIKEAEHIMSRQDIGGCVVQLPLPKGFPERILDTIPLEKDVDLLSATAQARFYAGDFTRKMPVLRAVEYFIRSNNLNIADLQISIIGKGFLVGKPLYHYLSTMGAQVSVVENYKRGTKITGDLVILSAGIPNLVSAQDIENNANVIDFGSSVVEDKTVGDLDMSTSLDHLAVLSKSPGGMGPLVVRFLAMNHLGI